MENASDDDLLVSDLTSDETPATQEADPAPEDDDDDFLIHDDMEPGDTLADLIGEDEKSPTETDDSLLNNLEDLVSDDYSDILASTPEEHDDSQYEDKWALELINQEPATTEAKDDLTAPDLDTIEAFEQGAKSFLLLISTTVTVASNLQKRRVLRIRWALHSRMTATQTITSIAM